jgi:lysophospholipase L1-like esterase
MAAEHQMSGMWVWILVAVALVGGVLFVLDQRRPEPGGAVAIVGDSITFVSTGAIRDELEPDYQTHVKSVLGAEVAKMEGASRRLAGLRPRQAVINLGTNDVLHGFDLADSMARYRSMVDSFAEAGVDCIHAVDLNTRMATRGGSGEERARQFNDFLEGLDDERADVVLVDWDGAVAESSERREDDPDQPRLLTDTVHPSAEGSRVLADLLRESLDEGCDRGLL